MKKAPINLANIIAYITGNVRYQLYYSKYKFLIRTHIREQIDFRIKVMDKACYENGECVICGCQTTALQMSNKACDKPCYPRMLSKKRWKEFMTPKGLCQAGAVVIEEKHAFVIYQGKTLIKFNLPSTYGDIDLFNELEFAMINNDMSLVPSSFAQGVPLYNKQPFQLKIT